MLSLRAFGMDSLTFLIRFRPSAIYSEDSLKKEKKMVSSAVATTTADVSGEASNGSV